MGIALSHAPNVYGYSCPWCPVIVIDAGMAPAVTVFELHVDTHLAAGHPLPPRKPTDGVTFATVTHLPAPRRPMNPT